MIRQAHTYLAGAVSSTALVAAAIVAFVGLVSFQALRDWPLAGIGIGGGDSAATGPSNPGAGSATSPAEAGGASVTTGPVLARGSSRNGNGRSAAKRDQVAVDASPTAATGSPTAEAPTSSPAGQGGSTGAPSGSPTGSASSSPTQGGGGGGSGPAPGSGSGSSAGGSSQSTSGAIAGAVNKTVSGVDEATGGAIGSTGVPEVTEKVVEGVAGPESTVGHTVDEVVKTVGGLLGGSK
jgi:hypothetical protein